MYESKSRKPRNLTATILGVEDLCGIGWPIRRGVCGRVRVRHLDGGLQDVGVGEGVEAPVTEGAVLRSLDIARSAGDGKFQDSGGCRSAGPEAGTARGPEQGDDGGPEGMRKVEHAGIGSDKEGETFKEAHQGEEAGRLGGKIQKHRRTWDLLRQMADGGKLSFVGQPENAEILREAPRKGKPALGRKALRGAPREARDADPWTRGEEAPSAGAQGSGGREANDAVIGRGFNTQCLQECEQSIQDVGVAEGAPDGNTAQEAAGRRAHKIAGAKEFRGQGTAEIALRVNEEVLPASAKTPEESGVTEDGARAAVIGNGNCIHRGIGVLEEVLKGRGHETQPGDVRARKGLTEGPNEGHLEHEVAQVAAAHEDRNV